MFADNYCCECAVEWVANGGGGGGWTFWWVSVGSSCRAVAAVPCVQEVSRKRRGGNFASTQSQMTEPATTHVVLQTPSTAETTGRARAAVLAAAHDRTAAFFSLRRRDAGPLLPVGVRLFDAVVTSSFDGARVFAWQNGDRASALAVVPDAGGSGHLANSLRVRQADLLAVSDAADARRFRHTKALLGYADARALRDALLEEIDEVPVADLPFGNLLWVLRDGSSALPPSVQRGIQHLHCLARAGSPLPEKLLGQMATIGVTGRGEDVDLVGASAFVLLRALFPSVERLDAIGCDHNDALARRHAPFDPRSDGVGTCLPLPLGIHAAALDVDAAWLAHVGHTCNPRTQRIAARVACEASQAFLSSTAPTLPSSMCQLTVGEEDPIVFIEVVDAEGLERAKAQFPNSWEHEWLAKLEKQLGDPMPGVQAGVPHFTGAVRTMNVQYARKFGGGRRYGTPATDAKGPVCIEDGEKWEGILSAQGCPRKFRSYLYGRICRDIDVVNCHPCILLSIATRMQLDTPALASYVADRDKWFETVAEAHSVTGDAATKKDAVKNLFTRLIYGGTFRGWCKDRLGRKHNQPSTLPHPCITAFEADLLLVRDALFASDEWKTYCTRLYAHVRDTRNLDDDRAKRSVFSRVAQKLEDATLYVMQRSFAREGVPCMALIFDGLMVRGNADVEKAMRRSEREISLELGLDIRLLEKPLYTTELPVAC